MKHLNKLYSRCEKHLDNNTLKSLHYLCKTTNKEHKNIALRMDFQLEYICKHNCAWLKNKLESFFDEGEVKIENFNGLLGEIRSYGKLLELKERCYYISQIETPKSGSDFLVIIDNQSINIEVNTPQESGVKKTTLNIEEHSRTTDKHTIKTTISSNAPYGYPVREIDNIQYEAVSKFSQIKAEKENKQFTKEDISILWLDLNDPTIFMFNQVDYTTPFLSYNGQISSGFIWNAFYSKKYDNIYSSYLGLSKDIIKMEFDGRFTKSNIDFVIIDCFTQKVIFENHNSTKTPPNELYKAFFQLYNLNNQNSILSFNRKNQLSELIKFERECSNGLTSLYKEKC